MDEIVSFIESNPGISFLNLQLFFGVEIKHGGLTEKAIHAACLAKHPDGSVQLGTPDVDDYVVNIPLSVFDAHVTEITAEEVKAICDNILLLKEPIRIVLNEQQPNYQEFLDTDIQDFELPVLTTAYDFIKDQKDAVSKVREMLQDFQPMFLERKSHSILNQMSLYGVPIFKSVSDFIKAFTDTKFAKFYNDIEGEKPELVPLQPFGPTWEGSFGAITLTVHVMEGRQGTGAGGKINAGNVIQAALLYKDRKNDFVRSNSAMSMIQYCPTQWPDGSVSRKEGTNYTFSDLYTGEKIVQKYDGKLADYPPQGVPFASMLTRYHVPSKDKAIYTNQEHLVAVYPASCIFKDDCYYETLVQNLIMISQLANSAVNIKQYESPLGKLKYVYDVHEQQKKDLAGLLLLTKMQLCRTAACFTDGVELDTDLETIKTQIQEKEVELVLLHYMTAQELNNVLIKLGEAVKALPPAPPGAPTLPIAKKLSVESERKELLEKKQVLSSMIDNIQINLAHLAQAKKLFTIVPSEKKSDPNYASAKRMFVDFNEEKEYHTRKALVMGRLAKMQDCCLDVTNSKNKSLSLHRRNIVLSCIDSVAIIIESAKISVLTVTTPATEHQKLVRNSKELEYLRALSVKLFHDYNSSKERQTASTEQVIRIIQLQGEFMEKLQKQIIAAAVTQNELNLSKATLERHEVDKKMSDELIVSLTSLSGPLTPEVVQDIQESLKEKHAESINICDKEIIRLKELKNKLNGEFAYVLNHLSEFGQQLGIDLVKHANKINEESLKLLALLGTDKTPEFKECMRLLTRPESSYAPVTTGMVTVANREDVFDDVGIQRTVKLVTDICPNDTGTDVAIANEIAADILNGEPAADKVDDDIHEDWLLFKQRVENKIGERKRLGVDYKQMFAGLTVQKIAYRSALLERKHVTEGVASSSPQFLKWMGRINANDARKKKTHVQKQLDEAEGVRSFLYFYFCNNPEKKPQDATVQQIVAHVNAHRGEIDKDLDKLRTHVSKVPSGPKKQTSYGGMVGGQLTTAEIEEQMNDAIVKEDVVKMYDLYIEHFDRTELTILFYQVYCILSRRSIYVPLYRCEVPSLEELIEPVFKKRLEYTGDLRDFDCVYADNFCVQLFGKNVNELLHDLSKGKLNVPRGAFPHICDNPFDPYSLICILEICRFFCLFLPFAGRLHFYFAGVLSFMSQEYSVNMVSIQAEQILSNMKDPKFFDCFHAAARMYHERSETEAPAPEPVPAPPVPEAPVPEEPELPEPPVPEPEPPEPPVPAPVLNELKVDPISVSHPPGTTPPGTPGGGTRRYRRYKSKTKRHTLNKRFKKNRTRRLHALHVRY